MNTKQKILLSFGSIILGGTVIVSTLVALNAKIVPHKYEATEMSAKNTILNVNGSYDYNTFIAAINQELNDFSAKGATDAKTMPILSSIGLKVKNWPKTDGKLSISNYSDDLNVDTYKGADFLGARISTSNPTEMSFKIISTGKFYVTSNSDVKKLSTGIITVTNLKPIDTSTLLTPLDTTKFGPGIAYRIFDPKNPITADSLMSSDELIATWIRKVIVDSQGVSYFPKDQFYLNVIEKKKISAEMVSVKFTIPFFTSVLKEGSNMPIQYFLEKEPQQYTLNFKFPKEAINQQEIGQKVESLSLPLSFEISPVENSQNSTNPTGSNIHSIATGWAFDIGKNDQTQKFEYYLATSKKATDFASLVSNDISFNQNSAFGTDIKNFEFTVKTSLPKSIFGESSNTLLNGPWNVNTPISQNFYDSKDDTFQIGELVRYKYTNGNLTVVPNTPPTVPPVTFATPGTTTPPATQPINKIDGTVEFINNFNLSNVPQQAGNIIPNLSLISITSDDKLSKSKTFKAYHNSWIVNNMSPISKEPFENDKESLLGGFYSIEDSPELKNIHKGKAGSVFFTMKVFEQMPNDTSDPLSNLTYRFKNLDFGSAGAATMLFNRKGKAIGAYVGSTTNGTDKIGYVLDFSKLDILNDWKTYLKANKQGIKTYLSVTNNLV